MCWRLQVSARTSTQISMRRYRQAMRMIPRCPRPHPAHNHFQWGLDFHIKHRPSPPRKLRPQGRPDSEMRGSRSMHMVPDLERGRGNKNAREMCVVEPAFLKGRRGVRCGSWARRAPPALIRTTAVSGQTVRVSMPREELPAGAAFAPALQHLEVTCSPLRCNRYPYFVWGNVPVRGMIQFKTPFHSDTCVDS